VLGHNCRFLQGRGAAANAPELARLREALAAERPVAVRARHGRPRCSSAGRRAERAAPVGSAWRRRGWSLCALCSFQSCSSASICRSGVNGGLAVAPAPASTLRTARGAARQVNLLNYRYDGAPFMNHLHISQVRNSQGKVRGPLAASPSPTCSSL